MELMLVLKLALSMTHALAGAAWLGAMLYSLVVLHPRAAVFFGDIKELEAFLITVSAGARWKVLGACGLVFASGMGLTIVNWPADASPAWQGVVLLKLALFLAALALFGYTSWWLWPARVFAADEEIPLVQKKFRRIGWSLIGLVGLNVALGVAIHIR